MTGFAEVVSYIKCLANTLVTLHSDKRGVVESLRIFMRMMLDFSTR